MIPCHRYQAKRSNYQARKRDRTKCSNVSGKQEKHHENLQGTRAELSRGVKATLKRPPRPSPLAYTPSLISEESGDSAEIGQAKIGTLREHRTRDLGPDTWDKGIWDQAPGNRDLRRGTWDLGQEILGPGTWARQERGHWPRRYNANTATAFARFALRRTLEESRQRTGQPAASGARGVVVRAAWTMAPCELESVLNS
ncbi:unnamed protein product [Lampetra planeri]